MSEAMMVERFEDMSPTGRLVLLKQPDGDVIIAVHPDPESMSRSSVEFCSPGGGGGRSRRTIQALRALYEAMEQDNAETPLQWRGKPLTMEDMRRFRDIDEMHEEIADLRAEKTKAVEALERLRAELAAIGEALAMAGAEQLKYVA